MKTSSNFSVKGRNHFEMIPQLFMRPLQLCFAVKLQKMLCGLRKRHPTSHRHEGEYILTEF